MEADFVGAPNTPASQHLDFGSPFFDPMVCSGGDTPRRTSLSWSWVPTRENTSSLSCHKMWIFNPNPLSPPKSPPSGAALEVFGLLFWENHPPGLKLSTSPHARLTQHSSPGDSTRTRCAGGHAGAGHGEAQGSRRRATTAAAPSESTASGGLGTWRSPSGGSRAGSWLGTVPTVGLKGGSFTSSHARFFSLGPMRLRFDQSI